MQIFISTERKLNTLIQYGTKVNSLFISDTLRKVTWVPIYSTRTSSEKQYTTLLTIIVKNIPWIWIDINNTFFFNCCLLNFYFI